MGILNYYAKAPNPIEFFIFFISDVHRAAICIPVFFYVLRTQHMRGAALCTFEYCIENVSVFYFFPLLHDINKEAPVPHIFKAHRAGTVTV